MAAKQSHWIWDTGSEELFTKWKILSQRNSMRQLDAASCAASIHPKKTDEISCFENFDEQHSF